MYKHHLHCINNKTCLSNFAVENNSHLRLTYEPYKNGLHPRILCRNLCSNYVPTIEFDVRLQKVVYIGDILNIDMEIWTTVKPIKIYFEVISKAFVCLNQIYTPWQGIKNVIVLPEICANCNQTFPLGF